MSRCIRWGDGLTFLAGLGLVCWLFSEAWSADKAERVIVRQGGTIFWDAQLPVTDTLSVPGPLGVSLVRLEGWQARILSDPSPHQYCVRQGWLRRAGESAICLPNQVSLELVGKGGHYDDSLNY